MQPPAPRVLWEDCCDEPPPATVPFAGRERCDVAVIGGGYAGLSAALHLAEQGVRCILLEAGAIGAGASGRNNGQVIPGLKWGPDELAGRYGAAADGVLQTAATAADLVFDLIGRHRIACEPDRRGWIRAAHSDGSLRALEDLAAQWQRRGAPVDLLDRAEAAERLGTGFYAGGLLDRRAGRLQPLAYARGLARAAMAAGAALHEASPALSLSRHDGRWQVATAAGELVADSVVMAVGAYGNDLWPGWSRRYITVQSMQIASAPLSDELRAQVLPGASAMSDTRKLANALRLDRAGRLCISGRGPLSGRIGPGVVRQLGRAARRLYPMLGDLAWTHAWPGRIAVTLDELPRLACPAPGLYAIVGFNGRGVAMATALGRAAARHALGAGVEAAGFPLTAAPAVPFHRLRRPALAAAIAYYRLRDAVGLPSR